MYRNQERTHSNTTIEKEVLLSLVKQLKTVHKGVQKYIILLTITMIQLCFCSLYSWLKVKKCPLDQRIQKQNGFFKMKIFDMVGLLGCASRQRELHLHHRPRPAQSHRRVRLGRQVACIHTQGRVSCIRSVGRKNIEQVRVEYKYVRFKFPQQFAHNTTQNLRGLSEKICAR